MNSLVMALWPWTCLRIKSEAGQTESIRPTLEVDGVSRTITSPLRNNRIMLYSSSILMGAYGRGSDESWPTFPQSGEPQRRMPLPWTAFSLNGSIGSQTLDDWPRYIGQLRIVNCSSQKITVAESVYYIT